LEVGVFPLDVSYEACQETSPPPSKARKVKRKWSIGKKHSNLMSVYTCAVEITGNGVVFGTRMILMLDDEKKKLLETCKKMDELDLAIGSSGNVSTKTGDHVVITPTSILYAEMVLDDVVIVNSDGEVVEGNRSPSIELPMHLEIYRSRDDVSAVVHTHSIYASAMAVLREPLPPIIDEVIPKTGGDVRVSEYAMPGSNELGENVVKVLDRRSAALIANHGAVCVGKTLKGALRLAVMLERACKIYMLAKQAGEPHTLPEDVVEDEKDLWEFMKDH
jgi:L-fuculose-phosphate aldolase